ncbi:hypothetical protein TGRH88_077360 [Toxoplasma gondii]|uniref:Uncharacterized protein n=1 Tax=Toxoplasma gondii TaxID=5811 RepID=A0A7J6K4N1_TOXGO|nr:hypothetical protein TGRH88_077360 [Toxoplasma gondii]
MVLFDDTKYKSERNLKALMDGGDPAAIITVSEALGALFTGTITSVAAFRHYYFQGGRAGRSICSRGQTEYEGQAT